MITTTKICLVLALGIHDVAVVGLKKERWTTIPLTEKNIPLTEKNNNISLRKWFDKKKNEYTKAKANEWFLKKKKKYKENWNVLKGTYSDIKLAMQKMKKTKKSRWRNRKSGVKNTNQKKDENVHKKEDKENALMVSDEMERVVLTAEELAELKKWSVEMDSPKK